MAPSLADYANNPMSSAEKNLCALLAKGPAAGFGPNLANAEDMSTCRAKSAVSEACMREGPCTCMPPAPRISPYKLTYLRRRPDWARSSRRALRQAGT